MSKSEMSAAKHTPGPLTERERELVAALRRALNAGIGSDGRQPSAAYQARAAIAKATGSSQ